ncbi:MAG: tRNA (guanosine(46)-N7)-methyltransferase TrmB [Clostridia bacterium]|nr:tRNA (guanosine(46)-N7)-methyltransferase TrmB [Clostridia bacterium]
MRMRKKKNAETRIGACGAYLAAEIVHPFAENAGGKLDPVAVFKNSNPVELEIGCGKGGFITEKAIRNPDTNFIAVERDENVLVSALEKAEAAKLDNLRFLCTDALFLPSFFDGETFERIYLNFSDPWPKKRHAKRRLVHRDNLALIAGLLPAGKDVYFKTDNAELFEFSLEEFRAAGFCLTFITHDLHSSEYAKVNVMTEYEKRFSDNGVRINALIATKFRK